MNFFKSDSFIDFKPKKDSKLTLFLIPVKSATFMGILTFFISYLSVPTIITAFNTGLFIDSIIKILMLLLVVFASVLLINEISTDNYMKKHKVINVSEMKAKIRNTFFKMVTLDIALGALMGAIAVYVFTIPFTLLSYILMTIFISVFIMYTTVITFRNKILLSLELEKQKDTEETSENID